MWRPYPIVKGAWALVLTVAVLSPLGSFIYDKYWNANTLAKILQLTWSNWPAVALGLALLGVLTFWAYLGNGRPKKPVPMQIAPPPKDFTGRKEEVKELVRAVKKGGCTIFGLRGMGGIGKTALAQKIARMLKRHFPDGQI